MVEQITRASTCTPASAADAGEGLVDQHAQHLALGLQRHVGDFVEIERAVMGQLEQAGLARAPATSTPKSSASMRSGAMVAQLTATKALAARRERAWIRRAATSLPEPAGPEIRTRLLVGAIFSIRRAAGDHRGLADQFAVVAGLKLQFLHFAFQPRRFQRALHHMQQTVGLERLLDEVIGALADRGNRRLDGAMAGDHHHRHVRLLALDARQEPECRRACEPCSQMSRMTSCGRRPRDAASADSLSPACLVS